MATTRRVNLGEGRVPAYMSPTSASKSKFQEEVTSPPPTPQTTGSLRSSTGSTRSSRRRSNSPPPAFMSPTSASKTRVDNQRERRAKSPQREPPGAFVNRRTRRDQSPKRTERKRSRSPNRRVNRTNSGHSVNGGGRLPAYMQPTAASLRSSIYGNPDDEEY